MCASPRATAAASSRRRACIDPKRSTQPPESGKKRAIWWETLVAKAVRYRGIFPVVPTTFDERGALDLASQKRCIDFMIDAG